jgi:hypothetical protein
MHNSSANPSRDSFTHADTPSKRGTLVDASEEQAFYLASQRLQQALDDATAGRPHADIAAARLNVRELAVKMRDAGYWRSDKQGLRATVSLLWQADRFVSDQALLRPDTDGASKF